jgi:undecaprenyl-diphosphatase
LGLANLAVLIVNQFVFRERPLAQDELTTLLYPATDSSFPSNPAAVAFAAAAAVWCFMRVYNGLFYPTDILAGAAIGAAVSWLLTLGLRRTEPVTTWVLEGARFLRLA